MAHTFDICIRGAGIVGRTLALLLARERLRVALVANPTPQAAAAPDVRAYALNTASRTLLESLRSWPDPQHATAVARMDVFGDKDGAVHFDAAAQGAEAEPSGPLHRIPTARPAGSGWKTSGPRRMPRSASFSANFGRTPVALR